MIEDVKSFRNKIVTKKFILILEIAVIIDEWEKPPYFQ